ncbi:MAG TPA: OsmC family protein [Usitatibacter sp.]|nr:OsmC family protein [Usitatibacter sp.]
MHTYTATVSWSRGEQPFTDGKYSRAHRWRFDGGVDVPASSSPQVVRPPLSDEAAVDPEEAFVAALSSCHMLFFIDFARRAGFRIDRYEDQAEGIMAQDAEGRTAMTVVTLRPAIAFSGERLPTAEEVEALHHKSHEACFIANSVRSEVRIEPRG